MSFFSIKYAFKIPAFIKRKLFLACLIIIFGLYSYLAFTFTNVTLPSSENKILFYSNQCGENLNLLYSKALKSAQNDIFLTTFGLSDPQILHILREKDKSGLKMQVFYDLRSSPNFTLTSKNAYGITPDGLLHQKIVVVDKEISYIGSANMTKASLKMHDNFVIGFFDRALANFIKENAPFSQKHFTTQIDAQNIEFFLLPDINNRAFNALKQIIESANESINLAIFTFTHPILVDELINAQKRGIKVTVIIDSNSANGCSNKAVKKLKRNGIRVLVNKGSELFHHKLLFVDQKILVNGSANWTKAAFEKNFDCFLIIDNLKKQQVNILNTFFKKAKRESGSL